MVDLFNVQVFLAIVVAGVSGLLFATSALSAVRYRHPKLAVAAAAFALFLVKGAIFLWWLVVDFAPGSLVGSFPMEVIALLGLDVAILGAMYLSVAKR